MTKGKMLLIVVSGVAAIGIAIIVAWESGPSQLMRITNQKAEPWEKGSFDDFNHSVLASDLHSFADQHGWQQFDPQQDPYVFGAV